MREGEPLIVVCGEALIDLFVNLSQSGAMEATPRLGGAPYNLAVGLARMGQRVAFCGGLSTDMFGHALLRQLLAEGVSGEFFEQYSEPTMLVVIGQHADGRPSYSFPVKVSADRQLAGSRFGEAHSPVATLVVGSHLLVLPDTQSRLLRIVRETRNETLICIDPNIRLGVIPDGRLWLDALERFLPQADIVKASDEDIAALYPGASSEDVAAAWQDKGAALVVVTAGARGAAAWFGHKQRLQVPAEPVALVDTVGAGDSFLAALLAMLRDGNVLDRNALQHVAPRTIESALRFAVAAASLTCARVGADLPDRQTVTGHLARAAAPT